MPDKQHLYKQTEEPPSCQEVLRKPIPFSIAFEIILMQSHGTNQLYHAMSVNIIVIDTNP